MREYKKHFLNVNSSIYVQCERSDENKTYYVLRYRDTMHPDALGSVHISKESFEALKKETFLKTRAKLKSKITKFLKHRRTGKQKFVPASEPDPVGKPYIRLTHYCLQLSHETKNPSKYSWSLYTEDKWVMHKEECTAKLHKLRKEHPDMSWRMVRVIETKTVVNI